MSRSRVFLQVERADRSVCTSARASSASDLHEAMTALSISGGGVMDPAMRPLDRGLRIAGPAVTAFCVPGDNLMMHRALYLAQPGDVLVVQAGPAGAQWGDLATQYAKRKGMEGVVVEGFIRDTDFIDSMRFPVWSTLVGPSSPTKDGHGTVNAPVVCGGVRVEPGDLVVADGDGVVVIPRRNAAEVVAQAGKRTQREDQLGAAIHGGAHLWHLIGAAESYNKLDVEEINAPWRS